MTGHPNSVGNLVEAAAGDEQSHKTHTASAFDQIANAIAEATACL